MSFRAVSLAMAICGGITRSEKMVLLALAERHNKDTGRCDPSVKLLARDCIASEHTVVRILQSLQTKGFIAFKHRVAENGRQRSNVYVLLFCQGQEGGPVSPMGDTMIPPRGTAVSPMGDVVTPYEGVVVGPLEPEGTEPGIEPGTETLPPSGGADRATLMKRFLGAEKTNEQVGALVDLGGLLGMTLKGGLLAAIVRDYGHGRPVLNALFEAVKYDAESPEQYMQGVLRNGRDQAASRRSRRGARSAAGGPDLEAWKRYAAGEE